MLEQKNDWVRFHAAQSIVVFGAVTVAQAVLGWIPFVGSMLSALVLAAGFILWIILMVKAFNGERFRLPWAADFAEKVFLSTDMPASDTDAGARPEAAQTAPAAAPANLDGQIKGKVDEYLRSFKSRREGRITTSAVAIA